MAFASSTFSRTSVTRRDAPPSRTTTAVDEVDRWCWTCAQGQSSIARVEAGGSLPTLDLLDRVGRALGAQITLTVSGETVRFGSTDAA